MAIELTGTPWTGGSSAGSTASVTVPADCTYAVFFAGWWISGVGEGTSLWTSPSTTGPTLGGNAFSNVLLKLDDSNEGLEVWVIKSPPTGSQTLSFAWNRTASDGAPLALIFLKGVNVSGTAIAAVRTTARAGDGGTATLSSLTTGDFCLASVVGYGGDAGITGEFLDVPDYNGDSMSIGSQVADSSSESFTQSGSSYLNTAAIALIPAAAGGSVVPVILRQYRARRN